MENCKNEIYVAVALLLCLWFKLDALLEYGLDNATLFPIASCVILSSFLLLRGLLLLLFNRDKLWAILKGIFKSEIFDTISWIAFLMPLICIEKYSTYFAIASWVLGDIVLLGGLLLKNRTKLTLEN